MEITEPGFVRRCIAFEMYLPWETAVKCVSPLDSNLKPGFAAAPENWASLAREAMDKSGNGFWTFRPMALVSADPVAGTVRSHFRSEGETPSFRNEYGDKWFVFTPASDEANWGCKDGSKIKITREDLGGCQAGTAAWLLSAEFPLDMDLEEGTFYWRTLRDAIWLCHKIDIARDAL